MAISNNTYTEGLSGKVGRNMVFRQRKSGKVILGKRPGPRRTPPTEKQQEIHDRFRMGSMYAKAAMADPARKAAYEAAGNSDQSAYNLALRDAFRAPVVKAIDTTEYSGRTGDMIVVRAIDDFKVASVKVSIRKADGSVLEEGKAVLDGNALWVYTAAIPADNISGFTVTAIAKDLPGNIGTMEIKL